MKNTESFNNTSADSDIQSQDWFTSSGNTINNFMPHFGKTITLKGGNIADIANATLKPLSEYYSNFGLPEEKIPLLKKVEQIYATNSMKSAGFPLRPMELDSEGKVKIKPGLVYHRFPQDMETIEGLAENGVLASEWFGELESAEEARFCAFLNTTCTSSDKNNIMGTDSRMLKNETDLFFDTNNPVFQEMIRTNYYKWKKDQVNNPLLLQTYPDDLINIYENLIQPLSPEKLPAMFYHPANPIRQHQRWIAIPGGIPPHLVNGVHIPKVSGLTDKIDDIAKLFPNATIFGSDREILYRPASADSSESKNIYTAPINHLPNRREIDRNIENDERYQAIEALTDLGLLTKLSDLALYHSRVSKNDNVQWQVGIPYVRADLKTRGHSTLHATEYTTAKKFAKTRAQTSADKTEIHHIISENPDARIFNADEHFTDKQQDVLKSALQKTVLDISEGSPFDYANRQILENRTIHLQDFTSDYALATDQDIERVTKEYNIPFSLAEQISGAINVQSIIKSGDTALITKMLDCFLNSNDKVKVIVNNQEIGTSPINLEYIGNWLKSIDVIGEKIRAKSTAVDRYDDYVFFELDDIKTEQQLYEARNATQNSLGKIANKLTSDSKLSYDEQLQAHTPLINLINNNLYAKPSQIIEAIKQIPGYTEILESSTGTFEKYTLGEHTETTLQVLDDNYADKLPANILPLVRMCLIVHGIGKPESIKNHDKKNQKNYNIKEAERFLEANNINDKTKNLIIEMIDEGMKYTTRRIIRKENIDQEFNNFCTNVLQEYLDEQPSKNDIEGLKSLCMVLQTCDSAAYTNMAITRSVNTGIFYKNHPNSNFTTSFLKTFSLTGRQLKLNEVQSLE